MRDALGWTTHNQPATKCDTVCYAYGVICAHSNRIQRNLESKDGQRMASLYLRFDQAASARYALLAVCIALVLGGSLAGCDLAANPATTDTPIPASTVTAISTASTPTAAALPTLPALSADPGWRVVWRMGYDGSGVVKSEAALATTQPFQIVVVCVGTGKLVITYGSESATFQCTTSPQKHSVIDQHPPADQISVSVSADEGVVWQGLIEVQG